MTRAGPPDVTLLLSRLKGGDEGAATELYPVLYDTLRELADRHMSGERADHTLQPTALVHEAYVRLVDLDRIDWQDRTHFMSVASRIMRRVLIDYARRRRAAKRGGALKIVTLRDDDLEAERAGEQVLAVDEALDELAEVSSRQARVVEMRFFGGLTVDETASALGISPKTVKRDWAVARAWLYERLQPGELG